MKATFILNSQDDTKSLAEDMAKNAKVGDCFALYGQLGAGKSTFARYFIQYLLPNVTEVPSPTFTIMQQYEYGTCEILHVDCYRLNSSSDTRDLGLLELIPYSISLIEWPERIEKALPKNCIKLYFHCDDAQRFVEIAQ